MTCRLIDKNLFAPAPAPARRHCSTGTGKGRARRREEGHYKNLVAPTRQQPSTGTALDLLRGIWNTGRAPTDWGLRRGLLRHKGKGADVFCLFFFYRGLGIGDTNAKIMAQNLTARLRKFLENTNALVALARWVPA